MTCVYVPLVNWTAGSALFPCCAPNVAAAPLQMWLRWPQVRTSMPPARRAPWAASRSWRRRARLPFCACSPRWPRRRPRSGCTGGFTSFWPHPAWQSPAWLPGLEALRGLPACQLALLCRQPALSGGSGCHLAARWGMYSAAPCPVVLCTPSRLATLAGILVPYNSLW